MISKNTRKLIRLLDQKKHRSSVGLFVAEGEKTVLELLPFFECETIIAPIQWISNNKVKANEMINALPNEIADCSLMKNQRDVIALFKIPNENAISFHPESELVLVLDTIQDPGNLGTIIRLADWFGIKTIVCSKETVDCFNPKVVQATMGALGRIKILYTDLSTLLDKHPSALVYGTTLDGENIYQKKLTTHGFLLMGNEGNGICEQLKQRLTHRLFIPSYPQDHPTSESLNVAIATAIVCAEFRRETTD